MRARIHWLMRAAVLHQQACIATSPLRIEDVEAPSPGADQIVLEVEACGCCRTDLHVIEGDLRPEKLPLIPGHQVVGRVHAIGARVEAFRVGERAGIAWLRHVDGTCRYCRSAKENLCPNARFTGYMADGGYGELASVSQDFAYRLPEALPPAHLAPLLCSGIIGYRALKRSNLSPGQRLAIYGFGSSAHVTMQVALHWGCTVYIATRGEKHQALAREMGAHWVGDVVERPPEPVDSAILFAPAGGLVPSALQALDRGGTLALAGIYLSDIPSMPYRPNLFYEKNLVSVTANTRGDGRELLELAVEIPIRSRVQVFSLQDVNTALQKLKAGQIDGTAVVQVRL